MANAGDERRRDCAGVRVCARRASHALGYPSVPRCRVDGDGSSGRVTATVTRPGAFTAVSGRWRVMDGVIATAVVAA
ncbi:hypothetical protein ACFOOM_25365 [Streptomyces echinoruber]|uniref:Uncharacterized protein n=1 Tax=Streptomyces echinoruber TaxID=68898 RepID=A0A918VGP1_9ACTN|nr:hypothetical protein GCM10010389_40870 [Streptomyces echinoruber]